MNRCGWINGYGRHGFIKPAHLPPMPLPAARYMSTASAANPARRSIAVASWKSARTSTAGKLPCACSTRSAAPHPKPLYGTRKHRKAIPGGNSKWRSSGKNGRYSIMPMPDGRPKNNGGKFIASNAAFNATLLDYTLSRYSGSDCRNPGPTDGFEDGHPCHWIPAPGTYDTNLTKSGIKPVV